MKKFTRSLMVFLLMVIPFTITGCTNIDDNFDQVKEYINQVEEKGNEFFRNLGNTIEETFRDFLEDTKDLEGPDENSETQINNEFDSSFFEEMQFVSLAMEKAYSKIPMEFEYDFDGEAEAYLLERLNEYRGENGLQPLELEEDLFQSSRYKSLAMLQYDYFSHENPNYGEKPFDYLFWDVLGLNYSSIGENLAFVAKQGFINRVEAEELFKGWLNSPSHNAQMLTKEHKYVGIGVVRAKETGPYYKGYKALIGTQHFGY